MKRQIRQGCFETNSSSMHSLTVMKRDDKYTTEEIVKDIYLSNDKDTGEKDCVWNIWNENDLYFGRSPFRVLGTFKEKWLYACASLVKDYNDETHKELERIAMKYIPNLKKIKLPMTTGTFINKENEKHKDDEYAKKYGKTEDELVEYLMQKEELWNMDITYYEDRYGYWCFDKPDTGSVDENILSGFLKKENISLEEFIINKKYNIIQDGDEYCYWSDMKKAGLVNMDAIDYEYPERESWWD